ncbi:MAG: peroxiredoxin family protein, partial [Bacteroidota bacterium]
MAFLDDKNPHEGSGPTPRGGWVPVLSVAKWLWMLACTVLCSASFGQLPAHQWGEQAPNFLLKDQVDQNLRLNQFKDAQVLVLVFSHYACPAHHLYQPKIKALQPLWQRLQGQALWIFPHSLNPSMLPYAEAVLAQDLRGETFAAYGIRKIPHIVVIKKSAAPHPKRRCSTKHSTSWKICYSGAVDADPEN